MPHLFSVSINLISHHLKMQNIKNVRGISKNPPVICSAKATVSLRLGHASVPLRYL